MENSDSLTNLKISDEQTEDVSEIQERSKKSRAIKYLVCVLILFCAIIGTDIYLYVEKIEEMFEIQSVDVSFTKTDMTLQAIVSYPSQSEIGFNTYHIHQLDCDNRIDGDKSFETRARPTGEEGEWEVVSSNFVLERWERTKSVLMEKKESVGSEVTFQCQVKGEVATKLGISIPFDLPVSRGVVNKNKSLWGEEGEDEEGESVLDKRGNGLISSSEMSNTRFHNNRIMTDLDILISSSEMSNTRFLNNRIMTDLDILLSPKIKRGLTVSMPSLSQLSVHLPSMKFSGSHHHLSHTTPPLAFISEATFFDFMEVKKSFSVPLSGGCNSEVSSSTCNDFFLTTSQNLQEDGTSTVLLERSCNEGSLFCDLFLEDQKAHISGSMEISMLRLIQTMQPTKFISQKELQTSFLVSTTP